METKLIEFSPFSPLISRSKSLEENQNPNFTFKIEGIKEAKLIY